MTTLFLAGKSWKQRLQSELLIEHNVLLSDWEFQSSAFYCVCRPVSWQRFEVPWCAHCWTIFDAQSVNKDMWVNIHRPLQFWDFIQFVINIKQFIDKDNFYCSIFPTRCLVMQQICAFSKKASFCLTILIIYLIACHSECKRQEQQLMDEVRYFGLQY